MAPLPSFSTDSADALSKQRLLKSEEEAVKSLLPMEPEKLIEVGSAGGAKELSGFLHSLVGEGRWNILYIYIIYIKALKGWHFEQMYSTHTHIHTHIYIYIYIHMITNDYTYTHICCIHLAFRSGTLGLDHMMTCEFHSHHVLRLIVNYLVLEHVVSTLRLMTPWWLFLWWLTVTFLKIRLVSLYRQLLGQPQAISEYSNTMLLYWWYVPKFRFGIESCRISDDKSYYVLSFFPAWGIDICLGRQITS